MSVEIEFGERGCKLSRWRLGPSLATEVPFILFRDTGAEIDRVVVGALFLVI